MQQSGKRFIGLGLLAAALILAPLRARAASAPVTVKWHASALIRMTLTQNYYTGFGAVPATFGTQPAPTHGPDALGVGLGSVDFGSVLAGDSYLYKYAAHVNVASNDASGVNLYGEGAADFFNTADSTTQPISQTLYYLNSTSGSPADSNTGFSPGYPFQKTGGAVTNNGQFTTPSITYSTYPAPIATSGTENADFYYDYQLKVPPTATTGLYYVWVVYTVVGR